MSPMVALLLHAALAASPATEPPITAIRLAALHDGGRSLADAVNSPVPADKLLK